MQQAKYKAKSGPFDLVFSKGSHCLITSSGTEVLTNGNTK